MTLPASVTANSSSGRKALWTSPASTRKCWCIQCDEEDHHHYEFMVWLEDSVSDSTCSTLKLPPFSFLPSFQCSLSHGRIKKTYGHKSKCLQDNMIPLPFSKTTIYISPLETMTSPAMGFGPGLHYKAWIPLGGMSLKSKSKVVGYPHNGHAIILQWTCLAGMINVICRVTFFHYMWTSTSLHFEN